MAERLNRCLGPVTALEPGEYTTRTASGEPAVCCKRCGGIFDLDIKAHPPSIGGIVGGGAVACPTVTCSFFDYLVLDAWQDER